MKEEEFLKEHPSLKEDIIYPFQNGKGFIDLEAIHETQLDKAKVKEAIKDCVGMGHMTSQEIVFASRLKKLLGLDK